MQTLQDIATAAARYGAAMAALSGSGGSGASELADQALRARVELSDALISAGWTPPAHVAESLEVDRRLLGEATGALESLPSLPVQPTGS